METGTEKTLSADFDFIKAIAPLDPRLEPGSVIVVTPRDSSYMKNGSEFACLKYDIAIEGEATDKPSDSQPLPF